MATIGTDTAIRLTMAQFVGGIAAIVIGMWGAMHYTTSGLRDDVGVIRRSVQTVQASEREAALRLRETETKLVEQIGGLRTELATFSGRLTLTLEQASRSLGETNRALADNNKTIQELAAQFIDVQKKLSEIRPVNLADPAVARNIATALKDAGIDNPQIVIVPLR